MNRRQPRLLDPVLASQRVRVPFRPGEDRGGRADRAALEPDQDPVLQRGPAVARAVVLERGELADGRVDERTQGSRRIGRRLSRAEAWVLIAATSTDPAWRFSRRRACQDQRSRQRSS